MTSAQAEVATDHPAVLFCSVDYSLKGDTKCPTWVMALGAMSALGTACWLLEQPTINLTRANKVEGKVMASGLAKAVSHFYLEYDRLPDLPALMQTDRGAGVDLLKTLLAEEGEHPDAENSRQIVFLEAKEAKGDRGGIVFESLESSSPLGMFDPYGHPFYVVLNADYADQLKFEYGGETITQSEKMVAVYSAGKDGKLGTNDDPKSW